MFLKVLNRFSLINGIVIDETNCNYVPFLGARCYCFGACCNHSTYHCLGQNWRKYNTFFNQYNLCRPNIYISYFVQMLSLLLKWSLQYKTCDVSQFPLLEAVMACRQNFISQGLFLKGFKRGICPK